MSANELSKRVLPLGLMFLFMMPLALQASTYYVRPDGGSASQCTGLSDAPYPGSGNNQACAFNHPYWALAPLGNNPTKFVGGDTLIIDGSNGAQYMMGYGAPNSGDTSICYANWPWDCFMRPIPSGPRPDQPTRILGKGWNNGCANPPQLWGNERPNTIINLNGSSNVEVQCLEVTDHSSCQLGGPSPCNRDNPPFGPWAVTGISASDSSNVLLKNLNIHGLYRGLHAGRLKDWTLEDVKIVANSFVGWDGDIGAYNSSNSGTLSFNRVKILYNGCGETYPDRKPYNCYSQDQGGYGDGLGTHQTGGYWIFNNVDFSHNVSDGLDLLYHNGNGSITIKRSRFEGNAGNQVKVNANTLIENSLLVGNCGYFKTQPFTYNPSTFNNCRAAGSTLAAGFAAGRTIEIRNSTITSNGDVVIMSSGDGCNGTEVLRSRNNIFLGGTEFNDGYDLSALYYASGRTGNGDGTCGSVPFDDDYSVIWNTKGNSAVCSGKPHSKCLDPKLIGPIVQYFTGDTYNLNLLSDSPAKDIALVIAGMSSLDYNSFDRGSVWDSGAFEYGSVPSVPSGGGSNLLPVCGNGKLESPEQCDDGNLNNGDGCNNLCVKEIALTPVCGNGKLEGTEQCDDGNLNNGDGCSSVCVKEAPVSVCGNGKLESGEQCDDGNLVSEDGCSASCQKEPPRTPVCGNRVVEPGETCDDGNTIDEDGCSSRCQIEPPTTKFVCGNGKREGSEQCDDGNLRDGDGCSHSCTIEYKSPPRKQPVIKKRVIRR